MCMNQTMKSNERVNVNNESMALTHEAKSNVLSACVKVIEWVVLLNMHSCQCVQSWTTNTKH